MAEEVTGNGAAAPAAAAAPQIKMSVLAQFVRDMSFENMVAQKGITGSDVQPVSHPSDGSPKPNPSAAPVPARRNCRRDSDSGCVCSIDSLCIIGTSPVRYADP